MLVDDVRHEAAIELMQLDTVDCLIPRGGHALIQSIRDNATVPVIIDGDGNCQIYVDASADLDRALDIVVNAKTSRPSVCNAAESLIVHEAVADAFLPRVCRALAELDVELVGDAGARDRWPAMGEATDDDYASEFLALKLAVAVVPSLDAGIEHVNRFGSGHTEAILTGELDAARRFTAEVDAATVMVERVDALRRWRRVRLRRRDRDLHAEVARAWPDGAARAHHLQVRRVGRRPDQELETVTAERHERA